ncbi:MAG: hypothetical protein JW990_00985 [Thermoleophilia bacterium]|nr:hypothetical protein [Thermoleophilia bacterium]
MDQQTSTAVLFAFANRQLVDGVRSYPIPGAQRTTLRVVERPDLRPESAAGTTEQDRQVSLEFLHRLVMG